MAPRPDADPVETPSSPGLLVGAIRGDGLLVPLAARAPTSEQWTMMSGYAGDPDTIHIRNLSTLPTWGWAFHPADGAASRPLVIRGEETVPAYCMQQQVLKTDALPAGPSARARPAVGMATHGTVWPLPIEDVAAQPDDASRRAARLIVETTQALEADLATHPSSRLAALLPEERGRVPVVIARIDRVRNSGEDSYYFEAHKAYGPIQTYARGWVLSSRFRTSLFGVSAGVDAGGESVRVRGQPLGALRYGGTIWIMETQGYEGSSYDLVDMSRSGQVISVSGGGC
jgi:hypothetical protein